MAIKVKAAQVGLAQAEIARRLLLAWLAGELDLPGGGKSPDEYLEPIDRHVIAVTKMRALDSAARNQG